MRLRQITLAAIALSGVWLAVLIQRVNETPAPAFAARPQPSDFPAAQKLKKVPGLNRPVPVIPIVRPSRPALISTPAPIRPAKPARPRRAKRTAEKRAEPGLDTTVLIPEDTRRAATPPPPLEPLAISGQQVVALTSSSARITWRTNVPTQTQTAFGLDAPTIWAQPSGQSVVEPQSVLEGLDYSTTYQVYLRAVDEWNRAETATLSLTTGPMPSSSSARTSGDNIILDDRAFFPTAVWAACSDGFETNMDDGINLFMGDGCQDDVKLPGRLDGRAYSIVDTENVEATGRGVIGWYYPDEWDAFLESSVKRSDFEDTIVRPRAGRISFLTLTNHFYSRAEPLPQGKGMYPVLFSIPDVIGFDLYPLQVWCRPAFGDVFDAQTELHTGSGGKPTFQWIEVAPMEHPCKKHASLNPNASTVRAETWLSIGGGADGVGYFPNRWNDSIGDEIVRTNREIKALTPALLAQDANTRSDTDAVRVSARTLNGALYVIAVNTSEMSVQTRITVEGIAGRSAMIHGCGTAVAADAEGFSDSFGPLAARVYVIPPQGW
ncbi:hypothetical protein BH18ACT12_BH18ACT12_01890 [soil metagenome]